MPQGGWQDFTWLPVGKSAAAFGAENERRCHSGGRAALATG